MSATTLKLLMMILMVFDHISAFISPGLASLFHFLTRPVAPVFAYMAVEGYIHTSDIKKYLKRLYLAAFFMFFGNFILNTFIINNRVNYVNNNIFLSLAIGVTGLFIYDRLFKKDKVKGSIILILLYAAAIFSEGGFLIFPFMMICYICRENNFKRNLILIAITAFMLPAALVPYKDLKSTLDMFFMNSDILMPIAGLPFIYLYNGKKGSSSKFMKYIFYVFYPAHLWIIAIIADKFI